MVTVPSGLIPPVFRLVGANRSFATTAGAKKKVRQRELRPSPYGPPSKLRADVTVAVSHEHGWPVYTITPRRGTPIGSVIYLHGGGWVNQIVSQHWHLAAQIAADAGTTVTVPIYPLVPFGTAGEVADIVTSLVMSNRERYGTTGLAGDSAGGQIALSVALLLRDRHGVTLLETMLISPALDLSWSNPRIPVVQPSDPWLATPGGRVFAELWRGDLDLLDPTVSPLFGDLAGLGPITVYTGARDVLNPDAHLLRNRAAAAGVPLTFHEHAGQLHVYPLLPTAVGRTARAAIVATLRAAVRS